MLKAMKMHQSSKNAASQSPMEAFTHAHFVNQKVAKASRATKVKPKKKY
jgi:hypothetical protein